MTSNPRGVPTVPTIVLVGHGMVGQRFLEALAERGLTATHRVVVLCEEPRPAYDRVQLTSYFSGRTPEELSLTDAEFIKDHGIELYVGDPAETIDRVGRTVTARSGLTVEYDTLVLATGSYPFVPPVPGKDSDGCFVYRTIEDLLAIEAYARSRATTGAVVGGGLLGLEAAGALKGLGLATHIVEFAPRLMPVQVDEGGGAALLRTIEGMGLTVHTGTGTQEILADADGAVTGMKLSDGSQLATDIVVFSAGVRPRDQLARDCGLSVGERGGITVDEQCRTVADPHVFAIGECALAADGRVYGLVAPGYEQAETAAATIARDESAFTGADLSTKLKLLGVDVASFGDAHGATADCLDVVYSDARAGTYKKLVIGRGGELLGGILVGDADAYGTLRAFTGSVPPVSPEQLVLPAGSGAPSSSVRPRCPTRPSSAPATTSARARSAARSPTTPARACPR
jgi:nitrite reductase (NADH) large subunit